jgi:hypothetical protein
MVIRRIQRFSAQARIGLSLALLAVAIFATANQAVAIHVGVTPGSPANTSMSPALYGPGWTQGDPGWANVAKTGTFLNAVYLGDGWVISAWHAGVSTVQFVADGPVYSAVPNQSYIVPNTMSVPGLNFATADIQLYRINDDPGLPALTLSSTPLNLNDEVMFMSYGQIRAVAETSWQTSSSTNPPTWNEVGNCSGSNCMRGYKYIGGGNKRWGTNNIANDNILGGTDASDGDITTVVSQGTLAYLTTYDQGSSNPFETQAVGGDSGSPVFRKRNGQWELVGVTLANYIFPGQSYTYTGSNPRPVTVPAVDFNTGNAYAIYGNATAFADFPSYFNSIQTILSSHADYSIAGDINLDGVVNDADISIFVANWNVYDNQTGLGNITSWKHGDLTRDGKTDIADFFKWRNGAGSSAAALGAQLGLSSGGGVPEPAAILMLVAPAVYAFGRRRSR